MVNKVILRTKDWAAHELTLCLTVNITQGTSDKLMPLYLRSYSHLLMS